MRRLRGIWLLLFLFGLVVPVRAQDQCPQVTAIEFPVDLSLFRLVQGFAVPSPRHQGRYHTGEDYYGPRDASYRQPVRAIAAGRVTYSAPQGWGRDGGVVIIEHTLPDGSLAYSQYGHMEETTTAHFPARYACIEMGDIIGLTGDVRPAPHLHFEIRTNQPDVPGPGYSWQEPSTLGWLQPSRFVRSWSAWLSPAHRWHLDLTQTGDLIAPPVELPGGGLMLLEASRLRGLTSDGRVLWRINLDRPAVGLTSVNGLPLLVLADGSMQIVTADGVPGERWSVGVALENPLLEAGDLLLARTPDNRLLALGPDRRQIVWALDNIPPLARAFAAPAVIGLITRDNTILSLSPDGQLLDRAMLREPAGLSAAPDGTLLVYSRGGLWRVDTSGAWSLFRSDARPGGTSSAVLPMPDGSLFLLSACDPAGTNCPAPVLAAYGHDSQVIWQVDLPVAAGPSELRTIGGALLWVNAGGPVRVFRSTDGALCGALDLYGDERSPVWVSPDSGGMLRLALAGQVVGLDWHALAGSCA